jgi:outer membrane protein assembly factor BamD
MNRRRLLRSCALAARVFTWTALPVILSVGVASCAAFETNVQDTAIEEQDTARQNYDAGEAAFVAERWQEAVKYFELVKNKYPYSKYSVLAELRLADAHFAREKWLEAADAYRLFVRYHPRHEKVAYATFRVAESHARDIDNNVAWLPFMDARQKDQSATRDTIRACDDFLARFPNDEQAPAARKLRTDARTRLADADLYAAAFYEKRSRWQGAQWRYSRIGTEYADTPGAAGALWKAGVIAHERLGDDLSAVSAWQRLIRDHPDAPEAKDAATALAELQAGKKSSVPTSSTPSDPSGRALEGVPADSHKASANAADSDTADSDAADSDAADSDAADSDAADSDTADSDVTP